MKKTILLTIFIFSFFSAISQNLTAKLIDKNTKNPIQYATIKTGEYSGVISNEEGYFSINYEKDKLKSVTISCLGYQNKTLSIQDIRSLNFVITLDEAVNKLNEVYISNSKPNADSIIARVKARINKNYDNNLNKYTIFYRTTDYVDFKSLDFKIEKASHFKKQSLEEANTNLSALSNKIKVSDIKSFSDFKGELHCFNSDSSKLIINKATKLLDYKNDFSIDDIQKKAQKIVLTYLDTTKTYKLKTGLFKIEDSLSLKNEDFKQEENNEYEIKHLNHNTRRLLKRSQFHKNSFLNTILQTDLYKYMFEDFTYNNGELTYIINFTPRKGKAKYSGRLFITDESYAITRVNYTYYKNRHGQKLNLRLLLGIKYIANVSKGTLIYEKNSRSKYHPKYLKRTTGSYFYVNRDLKFIENSPAKNKIGFSFKIEGDNRNKEELLFTSNNKLELADFKAIKQDSIITYKKLNKFEKTIWENEETLEPLKEMKDFKVGE
ncbi:carboxypeptidase-like regulatory domain-containing protein [uncultured Algibacter sp.]|uniref:carboxypeptidase-like regulatory domain-containing protein n=1 Tax=uncultured Algibacter sp. TaxID=298659 RepID=UPI00261DA6FD|nr:carboxypeptidase-like regulatory domain-containing protein [uncultured Algibacter sp.]